MNIFFPANLHLADGFIQAENVAEVFDKQVLRLVDICWSVRLYFRCSKLSMPGCTCRMGNYDQALK